MQQPASKSYQIQLPSGQQVQAMGQQLLQSIVQGIMQVLDGYILPDTEPTEQLAQWNSDFQTAITTLRDDFTAGSDAFTTLLQSWQTALADYTSWSTFISAVQSAWNTYTTTVTGLESAEIFTIQQLLDSLFGISPTTGQMAQTNIASSSSGSSLATDLEDAWDWLTGTSSSPSTGASSAVAAAALPNIPAGSGPGQSEDLLTHLNAVSTAAGTTGSTPVNAATAAMQLITNTLSDVAASLQSNSNQSIGATNSGQSFNINFPIYSTWSAVPVNTTYSGTGTGTFMLNSSGDAAWNEVNDGDVSAIAIFNGAGGQAFTDTDYQKLSASLAGLPNGAGSLNFAVVRANAVTNPSDYVYGVVYLSSGFQLDWEIGCYISGTQYVWASGVDTTLNLNFTMVAGVGNNPNRYQGYSGNTLVFDHTNVSGDPGGLFPVGSSHRYWGFRSDTYNNGQVTPAPAAYVGCADNSPPAVPGSGFRMYRTNTAAQSIGLTMGGETITPYDFFDSAEENSADMTQVLTLIGSADGTSYPIIQVANAGRYIVSVRALVYSSNASTGAVTVCPLIARYNSAGSLQEERPLPGPGFFVNGFGGQYDTGHIGATGVIACEAGDMLQAALWLSSGPVSGGVGVLSNLELTGESTGQHTYFEVTLANWSLA